MKARDASKITPLIAPKTDDVIDRFPVSNKAPVSRLISIPKRTTATSGRKPPKLKTKAAKKPPQPSGFEWRKNGAGWDLRKVVWVESATSGKQRKRPYLGHLSKSAFGELKRQHKGAALERAIAQWITEHDE